MIDHLCRWLTRTSVVLVSALAFIGVTSAHDPSAGSIFDVYVTFPVMLGFSATVGSLGGAINLVIPPETVRRNLGNSRFIGTFGIALVALAVLLVYPLLRSQPLLSIGGILVGGAIVLAVSLSTNNRPAAVEANIAFGVLTIHHALEGAALAAAFVTGSKIGLAAGLILTLHTIVETAIISSMYTAVGQYSRGLLAIGIMQVGYIGAALGATVLAISTTSLGNLMPAVASGVLMYIGLRHMSSIVPVIPNLH